jgi:putative ABC transport system permease protein
MLMTIFRGAVRQAQRHPLYVGLNVLGLGLGMAICLVLALQVRHEYEFNASIPNATNILRVGQRLSNPGLPVSEHADVPFITFPFLKADFPQILAATRYDSDVFVMHVGDRHLSTNGAMVDPTFFETIPLKLERGYPKTALARPGSVVLSAEKARALFGTTAALGRTVLVSREGHRLDLTVTGVLAPPAQPVTLAPDLLTGIPAYRLDESAYRYWGASSGSIFIRVGSARDRAAIASRLRDFVIAHASGAPNDDVALGRHPERRFALTLVSLRETHFHDLDVNEGDEATDRRVVNMLGLIGACALMLATLNVVNLATARSTLRAREVAVRKVLGTTRRTLFVQFMGEALVNAILGSLLGLALTEVALPGVASLMGSTLRMDYTFVLPFLVAVVLVTGFASGLYPALLLSRYPSASTLASTRMPSGGRHAARLRAGLVVAQFFLAVTFAICTLVIDRQARFLQQIDLGFVQSGLLISPMMTTQDLGTQRHVLDAMRHVPGVTSAALSMLEPNITNHWRVTFSSTGTHPVQRHILVDTVSDGYFETYRPRLLAGRWFDSAHGEDESPGIATLEQAGKRTFSAILNRSALQQFGFKSPEQAVGQILTDGPVSVRIIGVEDDMRFVSAREEVSATLTLHTSSAALSYPNLSVRFSHVPESMMKARVEQVWNATLPEEPGYFRSVQDRISTFYRSERRQGRLYTIASVLAIVIACMGLYGLASFTALRRTHEIGIRKTLGATTRNVLALMLGDFLRPVVGACLCAIPPAWALMRAWLSVYQQRIALSPLYFVFVVTIALLIAALTVFTQTLRVARAKPARALRAD